MWGQEKKGISAEDQEHDHGRGVEGQPNTYRAALASKRRGFQDVVQRSHGKGRRNGKKITKFRWTGVSGVTRIERRVKKRFEEITGYKGNVRRDPKNFHPWNSRN